MSNLEIFVTVFCLILGYNVVSRLLDNYESRDVTKSDSEDTPKKHLPPIKNNSKWMDEVSEQVSADSKVSYIAKHWRGAHSLSRAFWINNFLLNILLASVSAYWIFSGARTEDPVLLARTILAMTIVSYIVVYPWQIIGLWRSANRSTLQDNKNFWPVVVKLLIVFGVLASLVETNNERQFYEDLYYDGFQLSEVKNYNVTHDGSTMYLDGDFDYGISEEVKTILERNPGIDNIVLDSDGGLLFEGSELSRLILTNSLNTYTYKGCLSACTIAFISGNKRFIRQGARLGFHQYSYYREMSEIEALPLFNLQSNDANFFRKRGVNVEFTNNMYRASPDDMWYPTETELFENGLVHEYAY